MRRFSMMAQALTRAAVLTLSIFGAGKGAQAWGFQNLEVSVLCADGQCLATSGGTDLSDLSQVHDHLRRPINIFAKNGKDPREPQPQTDKWKKYGPIGIVRTNGEIPNLDTGASIKGGRSTAFLVSPCHVLTNYHSVFGSAENPQPGTYDATFFIGAPDGRYPKHRIRARPVFRTSADGRSHKLVGGRWDPKNVGEDWVLMQLDSCIGSMVGWMELRAVDREVIQKPDFFVSMAGFPDDKDTGRDDVLQLWMHRKCQALFYISRSHGWGHDCASHPGASGSPMFFENDAGNPIVFAFHSGDMKSQKEILKVFLRSKRNEAVDIGYVLPQIEDIIEAAKRQFGDKNRGRSPGEL